MRKDYLSVGDPELLAFSANFASKIEEDPESFALSPAQAAEYRSLHEMFALALRRTKDPATRTRASIAGKDAARAQLKRLARALARIAKASRITAAMCIELGLQPDNPSRARYPRPREAPVLEVVAARGRQITITLRGKDQLRRPWGVGGAVVMSYVGEAPPADVSRWTFQSAITRTRLQIHLPASVPPGATVWLCGRWKNHREQPGPTSTPVQTFVAGAIAPG